MMNLKARRHPRLLGSAVVACLVFAVLPSSWAVNSRLLVAWDIGVVCYLAFACLMALRSSTAKMQERAAQEDESAVVVLILTLAASITSLAAIAVELSGISGDGTGQQAFRLSIVAVTILCSWFFVHTIYAIHYAHEYYGDAGERRGLAFPHEGRPDYWDFLYFAFNLGAAAQTSDVAIVSKRMRRLALAVNAGAGLL